MIFLIRVTPINFAFLHLIMIGHVLELDWSLIENLGCTVVKFEVCVGYTLYLHSLIVQ